MAQHLRSITTLLRSHHRLLGRYRHRICRLHRIASEVSPKQTCFVVAELGSMFAKGCETAGTEFVTPDPQNDGPGAWVIPLDAAGLIELVGATVPDAVEPVLTRQAGLIPILIVDRHDEPALALCRYVDIATSVGRA